MVKTARTNPAVFFATCARLIPNDVRVTVPAAATWQPISRGLGQQQLRDEYLNQEIFFSLKEIVIEQWRNQYNTICPHSSTGYRPPATQTSTGKQ